MSTNETSEFSEPWELGGYQDGALIRRSDLSRFLLGQASVAETERIMLCVNYLAGIPNHKLQGTLRQWLREVIEDIDHNDDVYEDLGDILPFRMIERAGGLKGLNIYQNREDE